MTFPLLAEIDRLPHVANAFLAAIKRSCRSSSLASIQRFLPSVLIGSARETLVGLAGIVVKIAQ
jgi:hypothetical protein